MLEVMDINIFYGDAQVLWNLSFKVSEGDIVTIVGSNGAGKTTLLKTISGLLRPSSGKIEFLGKAISNLPGYKIVELGISHVPEGRRLFSYMTVLENLRMGSYTRAAKTKRKENLELVYGLFPVLKERKNQLAGSLSGGEQQMLAIARGLMSNPKLLMLDEPSLGLAPMLVMKIFELIREINEQGITILLVEQNVYDALELATYAYVLETGRITLEGNGKALLETDHVRKAYLGI